MQDSKINSTLKIGIRMIHIEGTKDYYAPALRTAPVFGGIAGIISSSDPLAATVNQHEAAARAEAGEDDGQDALAMPNFSATGQEAGEMQDMYRKTLSAYWASQPGELKADECIEDIFAGGDGWGKGGRPLSLGVGVGAGSLQNGSRPGSGASTPSHADEQHSHSSRGESIRGNASSGGHRHHFSRHLHKQRRRPGGAHELDEMDVREDLRGWRIGEAAHS